MHDRRSCSPQLDPAPRPWLGDTAAVRTRSPLIAALWRDPAGGDRPLRRAVGRAGLVPTAGMADPGAVLRGLGLGRARQRGGRAGHCAAAGIPANRLGGCAAVQRAGAGALQHDARRARPGGDAAGAPEEAVALLKWSRFSAPNRRPLRRKTLYLCRRQRLTTSVRKSAGTLS